MLKDTPQWVREGDVTERELLVRYARMANRLDPDEFVPLLSDFATYESQSVFDVMRGKATISEYLRNKILVTKKSGNKGLVRADVGKAPQIGDCVLIYQAKSASDQEILDAPLCLMKIEPDAFGKAGTMFMYTAVPSPQSAIGEGIFPGLDDTPIQPQPDPLLHPVGDYGNLRFELWMLNGKLKWDLEAQTIIQKVIKAFPNSGYKEYRSDDLSVEASSRLGHTGVQGFPAILAYWKNDLIYRKIGCPQAHHIVAALQNIIH